MALNIFIFSLDDKNELQQQCPGFSNDVIGKWVQNSPC